MNGKSFKQGDVFLAKVQYTDTFEVKKRPILILYEQYDNIVVAGVTSNTRMDGVHLTKEDGALKDSVIKLNYIFTISTHLLERHLFSLPKRKREEVYDYLVGMLEGFVSSS